jgi:serine/threonine protein kinase
MVESPPACRSQRLGSYDLFEKIADGGMGSVYRGRHRTSGAVVAVKIIAPEMGKQIVQFKRFQQEFLATSRLDHPNVVRGLDFGIEGTTAYLVMEYVEGESLGQRIERDTRIPEVEAVQIITQAAEGLHQAHLEGMIHRDVKPDNILLTPEGEVKLADLGLVKLLGNDLDLTRPNSGLGTPNFMAPEQFNNAKHADLRCDVYSLAATLYMAVTGALPFEAPSVLATLQLKTQNAIKSPRRIVPSLSQRSERAILRGMSVDPQNRQSSCPEFIADLSGRTVAKRFVPVTANDRHGIKVSVMRPSEERRAKVRYPSSKEGRCAPALSGKGHRWIARVHDVSTSGLSLIISRRFEPGTLLVLELEQRDAVAPRTMLVRVANARQQPRRKWLLGCSFVRGLEESALRQLV